MAPLPLPLTLAAPVQSGDTVDIILDTVRSHFDMEVAYLSEIVDGMSVFRAVSAPGFEAVAGPGSEIPLSQVYCQHILEGRLPNLITDTSKYPLAVSMPITQHLPIGAHMSLPVYREDGSVYGMFCCLRSTPHPDLTERDLSVMETFAGLAAGQINDSLRRRAELADINRRLDLALGESGFKVVLQPVVDLETRKPIKFEALSRFPGERTPDVWFEEARQVGRQVELEIAAIEKSLALLDRLPPGVAIGFNASPQTIASGALLAAVSGMAPDRLVVEITEHDVVEDYDKLASALQSLRQIGVRIAADDVGAGFSGLIALLRMQPDILKLDIELVRDIDNNLAKQSLVLGMVDFARHTGAITIAEGVETEEERTTLSRLGVNLGQGYLFARPMDIGDIQGWMKQSA
ncbi:sensor domain-containing phosphodiesterase [Martelella limonii]|uniref:sensor domain-containing phosphodiesterase n=1 Tax=Martelella limonii TaxID=1647649 RepID=UPI00157FC97F|nr:EAL domain-containing protein [Martelella limonii]